MFFRYKLKSSINKAPFYISIIKESLLASHLLCFITFIDDFSHSTPITLKLISHYN